MRADYEPSPAVFDAAARVKCGINAEILDGDETGTVPLGAYCGATRGMPCILVRDFLACRLGSKALECQAMLQATGGTRPKIGGYCPERRPRRVPVFGSIEDEC